MSYYKTIKIISFLVFQLFEFADKYRGKYDSSISVAQKYYRSVSGYNVITPIHSFIHSSSYPSHLIFILIFFGLLVKYLD